MDADGYASDLARELAPAALERFLRYVAIDTQADPRRPRRYPSTREAARPLAPPRRGAARDRPRRRRADRARLRLRDASRDRRRRARPSASSRTSTRRPDAPARASSRSLHRGYDGGAIALPGDPAQVLDPATRRRSRSASGTTSSRATGRRCSAPTTRRACAEIMAAVAYLAAHPELPRAPRADRASPSTRRSAAAWTTSTSTRFGADVAYTARRLRVRRDRGRDLLRRPGRRSRSAASASTRARPRAGSSTPIKLAAAVRRAPAARRLSPETTEGREGFVHPTRSRAARRGDRSRSSLRDHDGDEARGPRRTRCARLADELAASASRGRTVDVEVGEQYRNMREALDRDPRVVDAAEEAIRRAGLEPQLRRSSAAAPTARG